MHSRSTAAGQPLTTYVGRPLALPSSKPEPTYVGNPKLCYQYIQTGRGGWKAPRYINRWPLALP